VAAPKTISAHRGAAENPPNQFEEIHLEPDADWNPDEDFLQYLRHERGQLLIRNWRGKL
jgi:hypothetical protein